MIAAEAPTPIGRADLSGVEAVFSDIDGTLTGPEGRISRAALDGLWRLSECGIFAALVTGRPIGYGEVLARVLPVEAVVCENGQGTWVKAKGKLVLRYARTAAQRRSDRARLARLVRATLRKVPKARLAPDNALRHCDVAIDWNDEVKLGPRGADALEAALQAGGARTTRSSIHVHGWFGNVSKATACTALADPARSIYVGDAPNDESMFEAWPLTAGVANIRAWWEELRFRPPFVTGRSFGEGFGEVVDRILSCRAVAR
jgi:HAD superfamily hydrolase (TIGR01484 family)